MIVTSITVAKPCAVTIMSFIECCCSVSKYKRQGLNLWLSIYRFSSILWKVLLIEILGMFNEITVNSFMSVDYILHI